MNSGLLGQGDARRARYQYPELRQRRCHHKRSRRLDLFTLKPLTGLGAVSLQRVRRSPIAAIFSARFLTRVPPVLLSVASPWSSRLTPTCWCHRGRQFPCSALRRGDQSGRQIGKMILISTQKPQIRPADRIEAQAALDRVRGERQLTNFCNGPSCLNAHRNGPTSAHRN